MKTADVISPEELALKLSEIANAKFISFTYRAKGTGELAKYRLLVGFDMATLYRKDLETLTKLVDEMRSVMHNPMTAQEKLFDAAATEMLNSLQASLTLGIGNNPEYACAGAYAHVTDHVKIHVINGEWHIMGLLLEDGKTVIEAGVYKHVNHRPKTVIKNEIREHLRSNRIRQFTIRNVLGARLNGDVYEIDTDPTVDVEL